MVRLKNIHSLSDFQRNTKSHIARLKKSKQPEVLTVNGQAELVVWSAAAFQKMMDEQETAQTLIALQEGLRESDLGNGIPADSLIRTLRSAGKIRKSA